MSVTTKRGDGGVSSLPINGTLIKEQSKGFLSFEVLGKIDELDHYLQVCRYHFLESGMPALEQLGKNFDKRISEVRKLYSALMGYSEFNSVLLTAVLEEEAKELFEDPYKSRFGVPLKADFDLVLNDQLTFAVNIARITARALERVLVRQYDLELLEQYDLSGWLKNQECVKVYVNRLSDWLYECLLTVKYCY